MLPTHLNAQNYRDSIWVYGRVMDSFTYEMLSDVDVEIMRPDSSRLAFFHTTQKKGRVNGVECNIHGASQPLPRKMRYIMRFTKEGYEPQCFTFSQKVGARETNIQLNDVLLRKKGRSMDKLLDEVTVTATKIRMVVKGDTMVYDADAFQLVEGSMLDGLMKQLPGFELRGGQITVNGKLVSSLLVNGEDFFRGDPRVALENLPAYMVDKVKVYHKEHAYSYITQERSKDDLPLVVDVNLKREYSVGWVANAEVGYGLKHRYLDRIFGLRFTDNSRLALYANANNTNDTREPGTSDQWNAQNVASGQTDMQTAGFEALVKDKKGAWKYTGNAKFFHRDVDFESTTSAETFLTDGNKFSRQHTASNALNTTVSTRHQCERKNKNSQMTVTASASYDHGRNESDMRSAEFSADPMDAYRGASLDTVFMRLGSDRLENIRINDTRNRGLGRRDVWQGEADFTGFFKVPHTPDYFNVTAYVKAESNKSTNHSDYLLRYKGAAADETRKQYDRSPVLNLDANVSMDYSYRPSWGVVRPYIKVEESFRSAERSMYRLDMLGADAPEFGSLPSTMQALSQTIDAENSYDERSNRVTTTLGTEVRIWLGGKLPSQSISVKPEVQWRNDHLSYKRGTLDVTPTRNVVHFMPEVTYGFDNFRVGYSLGYSDPSILWQQPYTDDANPMRVFHGNPNLKASTNHKAFLSRSFGNWRKEISGQAELHYRATQNAIAQAMEYDEATGVRTFTPTNVDGNWSAGGTFDYTRPIDQKKQHIISTKTGLDYVNSVDYVNELSTVRNLSVREDLKLNMRFHDYLVGANVGVRYLHANSDRTNFKIINSFDLTYSATAQMPLPWGFSFCTDLTVFQRLGYTDWSLNDVRFVMNARLSRSILHGRLGFVLDAFDIFGSLSNVHKTINAQGIVETWNNSLPSYAMLRISYKLNRNPKKRQ
ncbi:MAG: outer membrane beta-barrel protein [Bacteroidales bacterium]|nr:outer membrane beta-barrel protein [Bacteroidales bacterium]